MPYSILTSLYVRVAGKNSCSPLTVAMSCLVSKLHDSKVKIAHLPLILSCKRAAGLAACFPRFPHYVIADPPV